jgi:hypothetical protein
MASQRRSARNSESAGISLEPDLKLEARQLAEKMGFGSLSNYTRFLLTQELARDRGEKSYKLNEDTQPNSKHSTQKSVYFDAPHGQSAGA